MNPKFSFLIPHVFISILMKHIMWWQLGELMTDEILREFVIFRGFFPKDGKLLLGSYKE